ncbi:MAG: 50S ribosomal protein L29 [Opitutales bacterium]|nr:50S ribosomal protein L29 [Opitutales bacterium]
MAKKNEFAALSVSELQERWGKLSQQMLELRMKKQLGQLKVPSELRKCKKDRARIKTFLAQKNH